MTAIYYSGTYFKEAEKSMEKWIKRKLAVDAVRGKILQHKHFYLHLIY